MTIPRARDIPESDTVPQYQSDIPLEDIVEFADNPEPRCPCVLILDTSGSMYGDPIEALNEGIQTFEKELEKDPLTALRVEVAAIIYDGPDGSRDMEAVRVIQDFTTVDKFNLAELRALTGNHEAKAINLALNMIEERKRSYRESGIGYYRPWIILIADGGLTESEEDIRTASERVRKAERDKQVAFFIIGVEGADIEQLARLGTRAPLLLKGLAFNELFLWLSSSMSRVSSSRPGDEVQLDVDGLKSWADI